MSSVWCAPNVTNWDDHSDHNAQNAMAFLGLAMSRADFGQAILRAKSVLEVGCGTGELSAALAIAARHATVIGTDGSEEMLVRAERFDIGRVRFMRWDATTPFITLSAHFSLGITSHVLEHFGKPEIIIDRMLGICDDVIAIVPYKQAHLDLYAGEGGLGHVFSFDEAWFGRYDVAASFRFTSAGWCGEQLAVLMKGKR